MYEKECIDKTKGLLKAEIKRKNVTYDMLVLKLKHMGLDETVENINNKINRGKFSAIFLLQCLSAIGSKKLGLIEKGYV